jgi:hypothetical protein
LVWLVCKHLQAISSVLFLLERCPGELQRRLREFMRRAVASSETLVQASAQASPRLFGHADKEAPEVPLSTAARNLSKYDGGTDLDLLRELPERSEKQETVLQSSTDDLWRRPKLAEEIVPEAVRQRSIYATALNELSVAKRPSYRHRGPLRQQQFRLEEELSAEEWEEHFYKDLYSLIPPLLKHICTDSCYKYSDSSKKAWKICRHGFYYMVVLTEDCKCRRKGKSLRNILLVIKQNSFGMQGRIMPFQQTPFEVQSNYGGIVTGRNNLDVQDMRRVLDPEVWLQEGETLPHLGQKPSFGYMGQYEWTGESYESRPDLSDRPADAWHDDLISHSEWREMLLELHTQLNPDHDQIPSADDKQSATTFASLQLQLQEAFADGVNSGFYVNSYTTKQCPSMEGLMEELRKGIQRLEEDSRAKAASERLEEERRAKAASEEQLATETPDAVHQESVKAERPKSSVFASTLATLGRLSSSYRRCYWKSGAETVFPILFNHLTFASHRCWKLYVKKAVFFAQEAWRKQYGEGLLLAHRAAASAEPIVFKRSGCDDYTLKGWFKTMNKDEATGQEYVLFLGPQGQSCFSITEAFDSDQETKSKDLKPRQQLSLLHDLLLRSATSVDAVPQPAVPSIAQPQGEKGAASSLRALEISGQDAPVDETQLQTGDGSMRGRTMTVTTTSLEDYAWRGEHPLLKDMSWSTYGMWVYRVEIPPRAEVSVRSAVARFVDVYFDADYKLASTHMQRISTEPRVPMFEGFTMPPITQDAERNAMYKQLQCRPFSIPRSDQTPEEKMLEALKPLCAAPPPGQPHDLSLWANAAFSKAFVEWNFEVKRQCLFCFQARDHQGRARG